MSNVLAASYPYELPLPADNPRVADMLEELSRNTGKLIDLTGARDRIDFTLPVDDRQVHTFPRIPESPVYFRAENMGSEGWYTVMNMAAPRSSLIPVMNYAAYSVSGEHAAEEAPRLLLVDLRRDFFATQAKDGSYPLRPDARSRTPTAALRPLIMATSALFRTHAELQDAWIVK